MVKRQFLDGKICQTRNSASLLDAKFIRKKDGRTEEFVKNLKKFVFFFALIKLLVQVSIVFSTSPWRPVDWAIGLANIIVFISVKLFSLRKISKKNVLSYAEEISIIVKIITSPAILCDNI